MATPYVSKRERNAADNKENQHKQNEVTQKRKNKRKIDKWDNIEFCVRSC